MSLRWKLVLPLVAGITLLVPSTATWAASSSSSSTQQAAIRLEDALHALQIPHVSLLFAYLESIQLSSQEVSQITQNAAQMQKIMGNINSPNQLTLAQKEEALRLFISSAALAHLQVATVLTNGQPVNLLTYVAQPGNPLLIELEDEQGKLLATIHPQYYDVQPKYLNSFIHNVAVAATSARILEQSKTFVPVPHGQLPVTASNTPLKIAIGLGLILIGAMTFRPLYRVAQKLES
ncbi:MAG: hypothetical protein M1493_05480 [Firmicutes bacterium]|jgi:hypothetical protein|uniref:Uncharacterized protein n=1 Tax=Sulfobacillus benefaciens TaxID=453960 RepID=A0A2T2WUG7_9FIRM|nr:hypothetical protein [Bacillota bacterium]PSR25863.1 MAG: hypothetical protein C7B43_15830 [Sulfobacillus benefaciens]